MHTKQTARSTKLTHIIIICTPTHTNNHAIVPEFIIGPTVSVNESTPDIEICVSTESALDGNVTVTAVTGMKSGATNQATGKSLKYNSLIS